MRDLQEDKHWHVDRRVPLALIVTILGGIAAQTIAGVWWASSMEGRVSVIERDRERERVTLAPQGERITRIEVKIENVENVVRRIEDILKKQ